MANTMRDVSEQTLGGILQMVQMTVKEEMQLAVATFGRQLEAEREENKVRMSNLEKSMSHFHEELKELRREVAEQQTTNLKPEQVASLQLELGALRSSVERMQRQEPGDTFVPSVDVKSEMAHTRLSLQQVREDIQLLSTRMEEVDTTLKSLVSQELSEVSSHAADLESEVPDILAVGEFVEGTIAGFAWDGVWVDIGVEHHALLLVPWEIRSAMEVGDEARGMKVDKISNGVAYLSMEEPVEAPLPQGEPVLQEPWTDEHSWNWSRESNRQEETSWSNWQQEHRQQREGRKDLGRFSGTVKFFDVQKGFGFIVSDALQRQGFSQDVYVPLSAGTYQAGQDVSFTAFKNSRGLPQAKDIMVHRW